MATGVSVEPRHERRRDDLLDLFDYSHPGVGARRALVSTISARTFWYRRTPFGAVDLRSI